ncbi:hypothetical protein F52700_6325 [Fusarium sp. NRRL 52700]|nr:hypothetical protein F52700_6325 [Fusarium sp. NRRL 52700]
MSLLLFSTPNLVLDTRCKKTSDIKLRGWPESLSDDVVASTKDLNKDKQSPISTMSLPSQLLGSKPSRSRGRAITPRALEEQIRGQAWARIMRALPMIQAKDWTEAETDHLLYLIDEEYWRLWREYPDHSFKSPTPTDHFPLVVEDVEPKPLWPWTHPQPVFFTFSESSRCLIHRPLQKPPRVLNSTSSDLPSRYDLTVKTDGDTDDAKPNVPSTGHGLSRALHWLAIFGPGL